MPIRGVIFDFGGVLCHFPTAQAFDALAKSAGVEPALFRKIFWGHRIPYDRGDLDARAYWDLIARDTNRQFSDAAVAEFVRADIGFWSDFDQTMLAWTRSLRTAGYRLALLSNLPPDLGEALRARPGFLDLFDHVTYSYEVRAVKPERAIYESCLTGIGTAPGETLFLDDRPENTAGAAECGIVPHLYTARANFDPAAFGLPPF